MKGTPATQAVTYIGNDLGRSNIHCLVHGLGWEIRCLLKESKSKAIVT
jgi:hypothetical protein